MRERTWRGGERHHSPVVPLFSACALPRGYSARGGKSCASCRVVLVPALTFFSAPRCFVFKVRPRVGSVVRGRAAVSHHEAGPLSCPLRSREFRPGGTCNPGSRPHRRRHLGHTELAGGGHVS